MALKQTFQLAEQAQIQFPLKHARFPNRLGIVQSIDGDNVKLRVLNQQEGEIVTVKASEFTVIAAPDAPASTTKRPRKTTKKGAKKAAKKASKRAKKGGE